MRRAVMVGVLAGLGLVPFGARASEPYVWSVDGSVSNSGLPAGLAPGVALGPNVSSARDGTNIEIAGSGHFTPGTHRIDGGGEYRILAADGRVLKQGTWKPTRLSSYRDLGTEPEGSPVQNLRAGIIRAPIALRGLGTGSLVFYCGVHSSDGEELEGVAVRIGRWRFTKIEEGSTTIEAQ